MLEAQRRKSRAINRVYQEKKALYLEAEAGVIRLIPQTEAIVRVSYTENGTFGTEQGDQFEDLSDSCEWNWEENETEIQLDTAGLRVRVCRKTGSIQYERKDGTVLLAERGEESKCVEAFDSFRPVINENTQIEEIQTPDGVKRRIRNADRVFDRKLYHTRVHLTFRPEEHLYGLGQAEEGVWNLRHTTQYLHQANLKIAVPMLISDQGYGILLSTQGPSIFNDTQYGTYLYTEADEYLDYYFLAGGCADEIVSGFRKLTGKAVMLPKWAFGYMQSQERYEDAKELIDTAEKFRQNEIPLDTIVLDWQSWKGNLWGQKTFDETRFPDPADMTKRLHEKNVRFMISVWPNMKEESDNYQEFLEKRLLLPGSQTYDAFCQEGRELYWEQAEKGLFRYGIDAWWCDSSEPVTPEWGKKIKPEQGEMYHDFLDAAGSCMPLQKSNAYGLFHAQSIYEGQRKTTEEKRVVNLTRSGYPGSQKYGTILWSGDTYASWETLKKQIAAGLQFCASGLPYWTLDIGAFFVKKGTPWFWNGEYEDGCADYGYRELYTRWFQYGAFLPVFRSHGTDCRREPWNFGSKGEPFYDALVKAIRLRYRLLPYIYSIAGAVWRENGTMMRLLAFDFPKDKKALEISDEYMFGPSLLICPVTEPMYYGHNSRKLEGVKKSRSVYLPAGTEWYDLRTDICYAGGQTVEVSAEIDSIPVFVKAGAIVPMMEPGASTADMEGGAITLHIYPGADGSFTLYEDAGDGYGYENGEYCLTEITYNDAEKKAAWTTEGDTAFRKGELGIKIH